jgi:hypothetical protein
MAPRRSKTSSLLDEDIDHVSVLFVQDPHKYRLWSARDSQKIDLSFRDRVQQRRIERVGKYFFVFWNPSLSKYSGCAMTTSPLKSIGNGETRKKGEARNGRKSGGAASRQASEANKNPHGMRVQEGSKEDSPSVFLLLSNV